MNYLAILGRQSKISLAELEALFHKVKQISDFLATFDSSTTPNISRLGGTLKLAEKLKTKPLDYLSSLNEGKITLGISDYSQNSSASSTTKEALKLKKILVRHGRSVRIVANQTTILSTATSLHNGLSGKNPRKIELIKFNNDWYKVIDVQDIDAYAKRDQVRPARDARVGMLPPKLAQILINLCGPLPPKSRILDPFCGTGVVLQEALLMGYTAYGTDLNPRMVQYSEKNLRWLSSNGKGTFETIRNNGSGLSKEPLKDRPLGRRRPPVDGRDKASRESTFPLPKNNTANGIPRESREGPSPKNTPFELETGDATSFEWAQPIDAVACEGYLGQPMSNIPTEIKLKEQKQECSTIILGFLKNLSKQINSGVPVVIATPAWLREKGLYSRLEIIDEIENMGYNVNNKSREGLLYHREGQIVARDILILRKK